MKSYLSTVLVLVTCMFGAACANDAATPVVVEVSKGESQTPSAGSQATTGKLANRIAALTPLQYKVTQENGTERPFSNAFWDNKKSGVYLDVVSGEPLFSSTDKFKSGTGWPSFTKPLVKENVVEISDKTHGMVRVEVRSKAADSHLGHVFNDGPGPGGLRYCINSASLEFVPVDKLESKGLVHYKKLFSGEDTK